MAKLVLSMDGLVLKEIPLDKERITVGRKPSNDIQIDNLAVSGEHSAIVTILNDSFLEDLNSTNGTFVNGFAIKKYVLKDGDVIEIAKYKLKYLASGPQEDEPTEFEKPMDVEETPASHTDSTATQVLPLSAEGKRAVGGEVDTEPSPDITEVSRATLKVLDGVHAGRELKLIKRATTLGRPGVQVAVITKREQAYFLAHVEGDSFPQLNGTTIDADRWQLADHDVIEVANIRMEFLLARP